MTNMHLRIASWNIEGRLSDTSQKKRGTPIQIINAIKKINADILILLEAHTENSLDSLTSRQQLINMGYELHNVPYLDDTASRTDTKTSQLSLMLLSKLPVNDFKTIRLADVRNALTAVIEYNSNQPFRVIGVHLDDRTEETRIRQIDDLSKIIGQSKLPTILVGDFNAMHGEDLWPSRFLRSKPVNLLANFILPSIALRATEMARGEALQSLEKNTELRDADVHHKPTTTPKMRGLEWMPSIRLIQIDHMFVSQDIKVEKFQIAKDSGADHRAIVATVTIQ